MIPNDFTKQELIFSFNKDLELPANGLSRFYML